MSNQYITIIERPKLKTSELLELCRKKFDVRDGCSDKILDEQFPAPKTATKRAFLDTKEADENLKNMSADDLEKLGGEYITLRERIIMELEYFQKTGKHLDIVNATLCAGSRRAIGYVPSVYWYSGGLRVCWFVVDDRGGLIRARAVVNLNTLPSNSSPLPDELTINSREYIVKDTK